MYRRILFLGLGGSGGKTLRFVKAGLNEWLARHEWDEGIPVGFQFAHIDTPTEPDGIDVGDSSLISPEEYLGLVGKGVTYEAVAESLDKGPTPYSDFAGWRVDPESLTVSIQQGAGQFRAVGRSIGAAYLKQIRNFLEQSIDRIDDVTAQPQLNKLYSHVHKNPVGAGGRDEPYVVIVSSLAGGTGAGILLDVCDTLRLLQPTWGDHSFALLYTPEVFSNINELQKGGVEPNSLAAICELTNGAFAQANSAIAIGGEGVALKEMESRLPGFFKSAGFGKKLHKSGPAYPFLVGLRSSTGAAYQNDVELFRMVGQSMVALAVDVQTQSGVLGYIKGNWMQSAMENRSPAKAVDTLVNTTAGEQGLPNISGIGFARISIGTKQFEEYAARRVAKDAAIWIGRYHINSDEAQAFLGNRKNMSPDQVADGIAERHFDWFISQCKLQERGPDKNDILEALKPEGIDQIQRGVRQRIKDSLKKVEAQPGRKWEADINIAINNHLVSYARDWEVKLQESFTRWVADTPERVLAVVREAVANFGTAVTAKLIGRLIHELGNESDGVVIELLGDSELAQYSDWSSREYWGARVQTALTEAGGGRLEAEDPAIDKAVGEGFGAARFAYMVPTCERGSLMLKEFCSGFLRPLQMKVGDATNDLRNQINAVGSWPGWPAPGEAQVVPDDLKPGDAERTLLSIDDFPSLFTKNLAIHFSRDVTEDAQNKRDVRHEVISGKFIDEQLATSNEKEKYFPLVAIQMTGKWRPSSAVIGGARAADAVRLDVRFSVHQLLDRAKAWLNNGDGVFQDLLKANLRTFTQETEAFNPAFGLTSEDYVARRERFIEVLETAIGLSDPLVGLDDDLLQQLHPLSKGAGPIRRFSTIPFDGDHKLHAPVLEKLKRAQNPTQKGQFDVKMNSDDKCISIELYSFLPAPHSPLVIRSLMEPISQVWTPIAADGSAASVDVSNFWFLRRTRPLMEFIPAPQPHIHAMIRGWHVGKLLGLINNKTSDSAITIVDPYKNPGPEDVADHTYEFPYPTLSPPNGDNLATTLEALAIAYVQVGVDDKIRPLHPYVLLRRFGTSSWNHDKSLLDWRVLNDLCKKWLHDGEVPGSTQNLMLIPDAKALSVSQRRTRAVEKMQSIKDDYIRDYKVWLKDVDLSKKRLGGSPLWPGIWPAVERSLSQLQLTFGAEEAEKHNDDVR